MDINIIGYTFFFKVLLRESKLSLGVHTFCQFCYCQSCNQPNITWMTLFFKKNHMCNMNGYFSRGPVELKFGKQMARK